VYSKIGITFSMLIRIAVEEFQPCERGMQDIMIKDLQWKVAELIHHLAQTMKLTHDMDDRNLESSFENLYHNPALGREHCGRNDLYKDIGFKIIIPDFSSDVLC